MTNYEILLKTIDTLKYSQGFYSRLANRMAEMTQEERNNVKQTVNNLPQWANSLDCVLFLES